MPSSMRQRVATRVRKVRQQPPLSTLKKQRRPRKKRMTEMGVRNVDLTDLDALSKLSSSTLTAPTEDYLHYSTTCSPPDSNCDSTTPTTSFIPLPPSASTSSSVSSTESIYLCAGCGFSIQDRFVLKVNEETYHETCLRCAACQIPLSSSATCFHKDGQIYCREDHAILFGSKCRRCALPLNATDLVFRCLHTTYHQSCFSCVCCGVSFKKGDEYHILNDDALCRTDYQMMCAQQPALHIPAAALYDYDLSESNRKTPKRPRTILNAQQRRQFKIAFEKSPKPCRKIREQLAKDTNLSVRVVQVWFQNQRAKMKKQQRKEEKNGGSSEAKEDNKSESEDEMDSDGEDLENSNKGPSLSSLDYNKESFEGFAPSSFLPLPSSSVTGQPPVAPLEKLYNMQHTYFSFA